VDLGGQEAEDGQRQKDEDAEEDRRRRCCVVDVDKEGYELADTATGGQSALKYHLGVFIFVVVVGQLADYSWTTSDTITLKCSSTKLSKSITRQRHERWHH